MPDNGLFASFALVVPTLGPETSGWAVFAVASRWRFDRLGRLPGIIRDPGMDRAADRPAYVVRRLRPGPFARTPRVFAGTTKEENSDEKTQIVDNGRCGRVFSLSSAVGRVDDPLQLEPGYAQFKPGHDGPSLDFDISIIVLVLPSR